MRNYKNRNKKSITINKNFIDIFNQFTFIYKKSILAKTIIIIRFSYYTR